jgi:hypothetical protein
MHVAAWRQALFQFVESPRGLFYLPLPPRGAVSVGESPRIFKATPTAGGCELFGGGLYLAKTPAHRGRHLVLKCTISCAFHFQP